MRTILNKPFVMLYALLLLIACEEGNSTLQLDAINVTAHVIEPTKAGYDGGVIPDSFIINVYQGTNPTFNYSLIQMNRDESDNGYVSSESLFWATSDHSEVIVKAMTIPYGLTSIDISNPMEIQVCLDQSSEDNVLSSDLLGATSDNGVTIEENDIIIGFKHLLTKLEVSYDFDDEFTQNEVSILSVELKNICYSGGYNFSTMSCAATIDLQYGDVVMFHNDNEKNAEAIFFPCAPSESPTLVLNAMIDGKEYTLSCPVTANSDEGFVAGKRYKMDVIIKGTTISGTSATIASGWDTNTEEQSFVTE